MASPPAVHLYHLSPDLSSAVLTARLRAILDLAEQSLPERPEPACRGMRLDQDTINPSGQLLAANLVLCPKPHIGANMFDVVDADRQCLQDPRVCHIIGKAAQFQRPEVIRAASLADLDKKGSDLRTQSDGQLRQAERDGHEEQAEQIRQQVFERVGLATELYAKTRGNLRVHEGMFEKWVFGSYWKGHVRALSQAARDMLLSGEFVWHEYDKVELADWAAPAVQYCRALEYEIRRRIYNHHPAAPNDANAFRVTGAGWTLGTMDRLYRLYLRPNGLRGDDAHNWRILTGIVGQAGCSVQDFTAMLTCLHNEQIVSLRNDLAHGEAVQQAIAARLRERIICTQQQEGLLSWIVTRLDPVS